MPPGLPWGPVRCQANGLMYAGFSSHRTPMKRGKYDYTVRFFFSPKYPGVREQDQSCHHEVWMHLAPTLVVITHRGTNMICAFTSKKDPSPVRTQQRKKLGTRRTKRPIAHAIIIFMHSTCSREHNLKGLRDNGSPRPSFNDLMRPRHPFVFFLPSVVLRFVSHLHHVTLHVALQPLMCLVITKKIREKKSTTTYRCREKCTITVNGSLIRAEEKGLQFWLTRSHAILFTIQCLHRKGGIHACRRLSTPRPAPKIVLKDVWNSSSKTHKIKHWETCSGAAPRHTKKHKET